MSNQNPKDPWSGKDQQSPPDLIELIKKMFGGSQKSASNKHHDDGNSKPPTSQPSSEGKAFGILVLLGLVVVAIIWFISGFFIVPPTDQAPILRFGKYIKTDGPGLHWIPRLIDSAFPVNVQSIRALNVTADMLTQDENIVSVEIAVQYRVNNAKDYLFNVVNPEGSLSQVISSAMRQVIGDTTLDDILTTGRQKVRTEIEQVIKQTLDQYNSGIEITDVNLQPAKPPTAVTAAFDDAINAREDKQKYINKAEAYENKVLSMVKGQQARLLQDAQAYKIKVTQEAKGQTARFDALLGPYEQHPNVIGTKMYYNAMTNILKNSKNIINNTNGHTILSLNGQTGAVSDKQTLAKVVPPLMDHNIISNTTTPAVVATNTDPYDENARPSYSSGGQ